MTKPRTRKPKPKPPSEPIRPLASEAEVLAGTLRALRLYGVDCDRQNTGGLTDPKGQYVPFGVPGNADITGMLPAGWVTPDGRDLSGKKLDVETKREGFRPEAATGKERERFDRQLARLKRTNENGGFGVWVDDPAVVPRILERIRQGWRIVFDEDGYPFLDDGRD